MQSKQETQKYARNSRWKQNLCEIVNPTAVRNLDNEPVWLNAARFSLLDKDKNPTANEQL